MNVTGTDPIEFLLSLSRSEYLGMKPGLGRIRELLARLGNPEQLFRSILVGGTNGKGSTAAMLASLINRSRIRGGGRARWGLFLSPHLIDLGERMVIDGAPAPRERIREIARMLMDEEERADERDRWTFFEFVTATAFEYFRRERVDIVVAEVGLGGRLDATNVLNPLVSVITNISREHTEWLGNTEKEIAREKSGIVRSGGVMITGARGEALSEIRRIAAEKGSACYSLGTDFRCAGDEDGFTYHGMNLDIPDLSFAGPGRFQRDNAALALAAWEMISERLAMELTREEARAAFRGLSVPGRFQIVEKEIPIVLDGAHNPGAVRVLASELTRRFPGRKARTIFTAMRDKEVGEVLAPLMPIISRMYLVSLGGERAMLPDELAAIIRERGGEFPLEHPPHIADAVRLARQDVAGDEYCLVTGSLYLVGEVLKVLELPGFVQIR